MGQFKLGLASLLAFTLTACAFGGGEDDRLRQENENRAELLAMFQPLYGVYVGNIQTPERNVPLEVAIYSEEDIIGKNEKGQPRTLPVLKVRYREMDTVRHYQRLNARYDYVSGEIVATTGQNAEQPLSLRLTVNAGQLKGEVIKSLGRFGFIELTKKSSYSAAPGFDEEKQIRDELRALYLSISGLYEGTVAPPDEVSAPYPVIIKLTTVETVVAGKLAVRLKATYQRMDFGDPSITERFMDVEYQPEYTPARISMSSEGSAPGGLPNSLFLSVVGELKDNQISGKIYDRRGYLGNLGVRKKQ